MSYGSLTLALINLLLLALTLQDVHFYDSLPLDELLLIINIIGIIINNY